MSNIFILEDDPNRMTWFDRNYPGNIHEETADGIMDKIKSRKTGIDILFLDHDLGGQQFVSSDVHNTGMTVAKWLCEPHNISLVDDINQIVVHSLNPHAAKSMTSMLVDAGYDAHKISFIQLLDAKY